MTVYILLLLFVLACDLLLYKHQKNNQRKKLFLFLTFFAMTLILGLRGESVGEDTRHFLVMYKQAKTISWKTIFQSRGFRTVWYVDQYGFHDTVENGWLILCKFVHLFTDNGQVFLFIVAALTCGIFAKFIYDNSTDVFYSTLIFLCESMFMFAFNGARQMLAVALTLPAYTALKHKKIKTAIIWVIVAALIHNTALVAFIIFPFVLTKRKNDFSKFKYAIVLAVASPFIIMALQKVIIAIFPRYSKYFTLNYWTNSIGGSSILWIIELILILIMYWKKFSNDHSFELACIILLYLSCELMGLRVTMFSRVGYYFRAFLLLFFPCSNCYFSKNSRRVIECVISVLLIALYFSYARTPWRLYSFFW